MNMKMIDAYIGTGSICTMAAADTKGTIVNEITSTVDHILIGHPQRAVGKSHLKEQALHVFVHQRKKP